MYSSYVEDAWQQAELLSERGGGGPEDSDHQLLGKSSQTLKTVAQRFYGSLGGNFLLQFLFGCEDAGLGAGSSILGCLFVSGSILVRTIVHVHEHGHNLCALNSGKSSTDSSTHRNISIRSIAFPSVSHLRI